MALTILYVHGIGEIGGAERELLFVVSSLDRTLFHPVVVCPPNSPLADKLQRLGIPVRGMHFPAWRKFNHFFSIPGAVIRLMAIIRSVRPCLVHVNDYWWGPLCYLARWTTTRPMPVIVHIRAFIQPKRVGQYWFKKFDKLLVVSHAIKEVLVEEGLHSGMFEVIYSGVYFDDCTFQSRPVMVRKSYDLRPNQEVIGIVANIFPEKGHECLIHAVAYLRNVFSDLHCFIVGKGNTEYLEKLQQLVLSKNLQRHITFAGFQENVVPFLEAFDVFVLPSRSEGLSLALIEAMAMEKPVVATLVGGIPEVVENGVTGRLVQPGNDQALALAIQSLLKDRETRKMMGKAGRERVEWLFDKKRMMKQLEAVYKECFRLSFS